MVKNWPANSGNMRHGFDPWVGKIAWRRRQPTPMFLPRESHGQRSLAGYSPQRWRVRNDWSDLACRHTVSLAVFPTDIPASTEEGFHLSAPSPTLVLCRVFDNGHSNQCEVIPHCSFDLDFSCLLRNLYAGQEATVRTGHGTTDWFQIGKGVRQGCILSPCLFNLYAEYIMRNAGLEEEQAGIKIAGRNINNLRYVDDTTLMVES